MLQLNAAAYTRSLTQYLIDPRGQLNTRVKDLGQFRPNLLAKPPPAFGQQVLGGIRRSGHRATIVARLPSNSCPTQLGRNYRRRRYHLPALRQVVCGRRTASLMPHNNLRLLWPPPAGGVGWGGVTHRRTSGRAAVAAIGSPTWRRPAADITSINPVG